MHRWYNVSHAKVVVHILETGEGRIENRYRALDHSTVPERFDVRAVHPRHTLARLRARPIAGNAFPIQGAFIWRAALHAGSTILQQVVGAVFHAGSAVSVFTVGVRLPRVRYLIVTLHGWALLGAHTIVVNAATGLRVQRETDALVDLFKKNRDSIWTENSTRIDVVVIKIIEIFPAESPKTEIILQKSS